MWGSAGKGLETSEILELDNKNLKIMLNITENHMAIIGWGLAFIGLLDGIGGGVHVHTEVIQHHGDAR